MSNEKNRMDRLFQAHRACRPVTRRPQRSTPTSRLFPRIEDISDCPKALIDRLNHYFLSYKQLPGDAPRRVEIAAVYDRMELFDVIKRSLRDYAEQFGE